MNTAPKKFQSSQKGQALLLVVIFCLFISLTVVLGIVDPIVNELRLSNNLILSKNSLFLGETGVEDAIYRLETNKQIGSSETISLNGSSVTTAISNTPTGKELVATGNVNNDIRKIKTDVVLGTGISFHYGVQSGEGGFVMQNSSTITGSVYSGGLITGAGNMIYGDAVSSGASGRLNSVHATGTVYAHTIQNATINKDAYYTTISGSVVSGTSHPGSADQPTVPLPISDAQIAQWESDAAAGGTLLSSACDSYSAASNTCTMSSSKTLGPKKIPFNLFIKTSSGILTVSGPLWVVGNITTQTGPTIKMSSSLGGQNVAVIADDPANPTTSGIISIAQSTVFQGSGSVGSFVFMISQNSNSENGGSTDAIAMSQGASALVAYASHGQVTLSQSTSVKEVTAYKIVLTQSANVTYDTGLPSVLFSSGPSGGYNVTKWQEIQ